MCGRYGLISPKIFLRSNWDCGRMSYDNVISICAKSDTPLPGVIFNVSP